MTLRPSHSGFEPRTRDPERRDFFDIRRRLAKIEGDSDGGGSPFGDEVFVGPDDPGVESGYELWVDTDAPGGSKFRYANFAPGDVNPGASETALPLDVNPFTVTFGVGRIYRVGILCRALRGPIQSEFRVKSDGAAWVGMWVTPPGGWNTYDLFVFHVGGGETRTLTLFVTPNATGMTIAGAGNLLYAQDVGAA